MVKRSQHLHNRKPSKKPEQLEPISMAEMGISYLTGFLPLKKTQIFSSLVISLVSSCSSYKYLLHTHTHVFTFAATIINQANVLILLPPRYSNFLIASHPTFMIASLDSKSQIRPCYTPALTLSVISCCTWD